MKIVYTKQTKKDKKTGKDVVFVNFYVKLDNGAMIPIQHKVFKNDDGSTRYSSYHDLLLVGVDLTKELSEEE